MHLIALVACDLAALLGNAIDPGLCTLLTGGVTTIALNSSGATCSETAGKDMR